MKKICFVNSTKVWGGGEKWFLENSARISEDYSAFFICRSGSEIEDRLKKYDHILTYSDKLTNFSVINPLVIYRLYRFLKKKDIDVIIVNSSRDLKQIFLVAIALNIKIIFRRGSDLPIRRTILNRFLYGSRVNAIIANSKSTYNSIITSFPEIKNKTTLIYNGIKLPVINSTNISKSNKIVIGSVGRLSYQKNQIELLKIAKILKEKKVNFKLKIAGKGPLKNELLNYIKKENLEDYVELVGFYNDISNFYDSIDIFILTSRWEGFGYVVAEAFSYDKLVIAYDVSNLNELIINNKNGYLIENGNVEVFSKKIQYLNENRNLILSFGKNGREHIEEKFDFEKSYKKLVELVELVEKLF